MLSVDPGGDYLFSYGTLQLESVQMSTFGRLLHGSGDTLHGFELVPLLVDDPSVVAISGKTQHTMARFTGRDSDRIPGTVFALTPAEIRKADEYEVAAVRREALTLGSGLRAWVYIDVRSELPRS